MDDRMRLAPYQEDGEHGTSMLVKILLGGPALIKRPPITKQHKHS